MQDNSISLKNLHEIIDRMMPNPEDDSVLSGTLWNVKDVANQVAAGKPIQNALDDLYKF